MDARASIEALWGDNGHASVGQQVGGAKGDSGAPPFIRAWEIGFEMVLVRMGYDLLSRMEATMV